MTLHVYWHAYRTDNNVTDRINEDADDPDEEDVDDMSDEEEQEDSVVDYKFVASPGWIQRFIEIQPPKL